jgi:hypothetical protein
MAWRWLINESKHVATWKISCVRLYKLEHYFNILKNQQLHIYEYVQSHIVILQQYVSVSPATISRASDTESSISVFHIFSTMHRETHTWERPRRCTLLLNNLFHISLKLSSTYFEQIIAHYQEVCTSSYSTLPCILEESSCWHDTTHFLMMDNCLFETCLG